MKRWTLLIAVLLAFPSCGPTKDTKEPGEKIVGRAPVPRSLPSADGPGPAEPAEAPPAPAPAAAAETGSSPDTPDAPEPVTPAPEPPTAVDPALDPQPSSHDRALEVAVEAGLHDTDAPPPDAEDLDPVIALDDKGRIVGPVPDMAPKLPFLFDSDSFVCPGDAVIQGARPPKGRELGCRVGGMLVGPFIEWYENGQRQVERGYVNGVKQGPVRQWYRDGALKAIRYFHKSQPHGRYARWHVNGRKAEEGAYEDGKQIGPWTAWYPNTTTESEGMFVMGRGQGPWSYWYPNGQTKKEGRYNKGQKNGMWSFWYPNGQLKLEGEYLNDYPIHTLRIYAEDGSVLQ